jgi:hypothetical protein
VQLPLRVVLVVACLAGCDNTVAGYRPVGGDHDSDAAIQRYLRRAYLDLSGHYPTDSELAAATTRLRDASNTPAAREELIADVLAKSTFSTVWIEELENSIFGGSTLAQQYALVCGIIRTTTPACQACSEPDPCNCSCATLPMLKVERAGLQSTPSDLAAGTSTGSIEQRYAKATAYFALSPSPEGRVRALFDDFLSRTPEPDEIENGRAMVIGLPIGEAAGLMFHRHGKNYTDMLDIIFTSEVYRESVVRRVFERYLARTPTSAELTAFTTKIDATEPDMRGLIRAVVSSREYFEQ